MSGLPQRQSRTMPVIVRRGDAVDETIVVQEGAPGPQTGQSGQGCGGPGGAGTPSTLSTPAGPSSRAASSESDVVHVARRADRSGGDSAADNRLIPPAPGIPDAGGIRSTIRLGD